MKLISIDDITQDMVFISQAPYTKIRVDQKKNHAVVIDSEKNHIGIVYSPKETNSSWDSYSVPMDYFFWRAYNTTRAMISRAY